MPTETDSTLSGVISSQPTQSQQFGMLQPQPVPGSVVVAQGPPTAAATAPSGGQTQKSSNLPFDEECKLVYGVVYSLRNMCKKMTKRCGHFQQAGRDARPVLTSLRSSMHSHTHRDEPFVLYRTSSYALHLFETLSGWKFVLLSDPSAPSLRPLLATLHQGPFLEHVLRNPFLSPLDSQKSQRGIDNDAFRRAVEDLFNASGA